MNKLLASRSLVLWSLLSLLSLPSLPVAAAEWKLISETEDPDKIISWYVDMTSIVRDEDFLRAYLRTSWSVPQFAADTTAYQSTTYLNYFDCDARKIAYTGNTYYGTVDPEGSPVHQEPELPVTTLKFQSVIPGSAGETRLDFVCKFRSTNFMTRAEAPVTQG